VKAKTVAGLALVVSGALILAACVPLPATPVPEAPKPAATEGIKQPPTAAVVPTTAPTVSPTAELAPTVAPAPAGAGVQPLSPDTCDELAQAMARALNVQVTQANAPFVDPSTSAAGTGCQATATGTGKEFQGPPAAVGALAAMLEGQGWKEDQNLAADGPTGTASGFRKGGQVCLASAQWEPDPSANCPKDQPISACQVTPEQQLYTVNFNCASEAPEGQTGAGIANPASVNCTKQGGTLSITYSVVTCERRADGGEYGVCLFEGNLQCEEWAMFRGECPVGGIKVTDYVTPAARYCAITGGIYVVTGKSGQDDEQGSCTLKDGKKCEAWDYYNGTCSASSGAGTGPIGGGRPTPALATLTRRPLPT